MKKIIAIYFLLLIPCLGYSQDIKKTKFGFSYFFINNSWDINTQFERIVDYKFTHGINLFLTKTLNNGSKLHYGINYQHLYGDSDIKSYISSSCTGSGLINFTKYYEIWHNVFQLHGAYLLKPIDKKKNFFVNFYLQPGFSLEVYYPQYSPEIGCQGYFSKKYKSIEFAISGGSNVSYKIYSHRNFIVNLNLGINYQVIYSELDQINIFTGLELSF